MLYILYYIYILNSYCSVLYYIILCYSILYYIILYYIYYIILYYITLYYIILYYIILYYIVLLTKKRTNIQENHVKVPTKERQERSERRSKSSEKAARACQAQSSSFSICFRMFHGHVVQQIHSDNQKNGHVFRFFPET